MIKADFGSIIATKRKEGKLSTASAGSPYVLKKD